MLGLFPLVGRGQRNRYQRWLSHATWESALSWHSATAITALNVQFALWAHTCVWQACSIWPVDFHPAGIESILAQKFAEFQKIAIIPLFLLNYWRFCACYMQICTVLIEPRTLWPLDELVMD